MLLKKLQAVDSTVVETTVVSVVDSAVVADSTATAAPAAGNCTC